MDWTIKMQQYYDFVKQIDGKEKIPNNFDQFCISITNSVSAYGGRRSAFFIKHLSFVILVIIFLGIHQRKQIYYCKTNKKCYISFPYM